MQIMVFFFFFSSCVSLVSKWIPWKLQMQNSTPDRQASKYIPSSKSTAFNEWGTMSPCWLQLERGTLASQVPWWLKGMREGLKAFHSVLLAGWKHSKQKLVPCYVYIHRRISVSVAHTAKEKSSVSIFKSVLYKADHLVKVWIHYQKLVLVVQKRFSLRKKKNTVFFVNASMSLCLKLCIQSSFYEANCKLLKIMRTSLFIVTNWFPILQN